METDNKHTGPAKIRPEPAINVKNNNQMDNVNRLVTCAQCFLFPCVRVYTQGLWRTGYYVTYSVCVCMFVLSSESIDEM